MKRPDPAAALTVPTEPLLPESKIRLTVSGNPKRAGTEAHRRFGIYRNDMRVSVALKRGVSRTDLRYDQRHGYVKLVA